jgi:hypothetical protein
MICELYLNKAVIKKKNPTLKIALTNAIFTHRRILELQESTGICTHVVFMIRNAVTVLAGLHLHVTGAGRWA